MQVILPEEQTKEIQLFIANLIKDEIETVKEDSGQISPFLNKRQTCQYLGISNNTLDIWIRKGMPHIRIGKTIRFDKDSIRRWMIQLENHF
ncbi:Helix-turn-helix domain protein [Streptococcus intermedius]|uniref:helix-turn-helix domain-containing protein n=1 Tax=Streptococcus intermedius TaxID=1338 RepID=UPI000F6661E5|nr:helix-turn-helix domain-containing protein [Streptococcus intermedius]RSJ18273.1 Helix-turn-helix domain protein [Streptococcus intermedius]